jgi:hypothetical protein
MKSRMLDLFQMKDPMREVKMEVKMDLDMHQLGKIKVFQKTNLCHFGKKFPFSAHIPKYGKLNLNWIDQSKLGVNRKVKSAYDTHILKGFAGLVVFTGCDRETHLVFLVGGVISNFHGTHRVIMTQDDTRQDFTDA